MNPLSFFLKQAVRTLVAVVAVGTLIVAAGCGSSGNNNGGGGGKGHFTNLNLKGQYAFTMRGFGLLPGSLTAADFFVEGGVFTADGNGNITAGTDDLVQHNTPFSDPITGIYSINNDGSGHLQFNFGGGGATVYHITLSDISHFYMEKEDGFGTSSGSGEKQDPTMLATVPTGSFLSRNHDLGVSATLARLAVSAGGVITGSYYVLESGGQQFTGPVAGAIGVPTDGRGTLNYILNGSTNHTIVYYVVNSGKFLMLDMTPTVLSVGQAELQSSGAFSSGSLSGSYAFGSSGETAFVDGVHTVGVLTADSSGNITGGNFDSVQDGAVSSNMPIPAGTYTIGPDGFGQTFGGSNLRVLWMVNTSRAYFISLSAINLEDGTLDKQTGTFSNSSLNMQAALFMDGFDGQFKDRVGTLVPNGSGSVETNYVASFFDPNTLIGGNQSNSFLGSYSVSSNGRGTAQFSGFTNNLVFYLVSGNTGYILQADAGVDIGGAFRQQTGP